MQPPGDAVRLPSHYHLNNTENFMRYVISYDLRKPDRDYQSLYEALESIGAERVLQSQWGVRRNNTKAAKLRDHFWQFMDRNDGILVTAIDGKDWGARGLIKKISDM